MEERKFVKLKKDEYKIKEDIKRIFGKGKVSSITIEYTPIGEKIIVATSKPGLIIGKRGEKIIELTETLKRKFKLENPKIDIKEIRRPEYDAQTMADEIALSLERFGSIKFKMIAYKMLERIVKSGVLGVEIRLSGKLPSERAKSWRFAQGYLKKTGDTAKIVGHGFAVAKTLPGVIGVKVSILTPDVKIHDQIAVNQHLLDEIKNNILKMELEENEKTEKKNKKKKVSIKGEISESKKVSDSPKNKIFEDLEKQEDGSTKI